MEEKGWRGYIFSREIGGQLLPHRVQNVILRDYAQKKNIRIIFSIVEYYMEHCYMMLDAYMEDLEDIHGFVFYSTHLLPENNEDRQKIYRTILNQGCQLHFALEELVIANQQDVQSIEEIIMCRNISHKMNSLPHTFSKDFLLI
tara:strand:- start:48 stop:479 length:432 start_codon:yes stop_codon:yes gene_type:complete